MAKTLTFLTTGTSWSVPLDWDNVFNSIEVLAGGGGGAMGQNGVANGNPGGGAAYSINSGNVLTPGASLNMAVGAGGSGGASLNTSGATGGDTWIANNNTATVITSSGVIVGAKGGGGGTTSTGGIGGASASGVGSLKYSGGDGGHTGGHSGGGGGAAGPNGVGATGGLDDNTQNGGAGGGAGGGGSAGGARSGTTGGAGGNNAVGVGSGAGGTSGNSGSAGTAGGGGGGGGAGATNSGGSGGPGAEWDATHGSGGGGGQNSGNFTATSGHGGDGGLYGGGGGGLQAGATGMRSGNGAQGIAVVTYGLDAVRAVTWNPADKASMTLTGGNLIATSTTLGWSSLARGTTYYTYGTYYFEAVVTGNGGTSAGNAAIGFANSPQSSFLGSTAANGFGYYPLNGSMSDFTNSAAPAANGDNIGIAVNFNTKKMWVRVNGGNWNNSGTADPVSGVGGFSFTAGAFLYPFCGMNAASITWSANFGASAFGYTPPSGFIGLSTLTSGYDATQFFNCL